MILHRISRLLLLLAVALAFTAAGTYTADAQKKSKAKPPAHQQPAKKADQGQEGENADEPAVQPQQQATPSTGGIVSWLKKFVDQKTNLGTLREVTRDCIVLEDENTTTIIPLTMINSLKQIKEDDPPSVRLEIYLLKRD